MDLIKIEVEYLRSANYTLLHNGIPVCQAVEVTNQSDVPLEDVKVSCDGEFILRHDSDIISRINPGETVRLSPYKVSPDPAKLSNITERILTSFKLMVTCGEELIAEEILEIELMPYDYWTGTKIFPQTITSFITPNHPAIKKLVIRSASVLKSLTGSSAFNEYQSGNSNNVRHQVAAVFSAIHDMGIVYRGLPPSYEDIGQRITMPDQVILSKIGNCIELTLLMASVLEAIGLNCLVIFQQKHAYLGVWLVDDCYSCSVCDDPAFIEKKCSRGINEMLVIECTHLAQENVSFEEAVRAAELNLANHSVFEMFVDVKRSRLERILPLPARVENNGVWTFETSGIDHDYCEINVKEHDRYDLNRISSNNKELTKFDIWERKLLDFSLRNSLLNLSLRRRAVQFISFEIDRLEDHLQDGDEYRILSKPNVEISFETDGNLVRSKLYDTLHELILNDIEHNQLHTFMPEGETRSMLKNIYRAARNAIEETGANSLFLSIGTLRWFETEQSPTPRYAPLLLLPVEMVYKKGNYYIRSRDEEISLNITLMEFLRQNYDININGLSPLPRDASGVDVALIFAIIRDALKTQKRWDVEEECLLGTFSFSKFLMWNDIHTHRERLKENRIIDSLAANHLTWTQDPVVSDLKEIDRQISPVDTALPMPVDSSQMAAVLEGGKGNSFILYGPPGTGKSQTITNLIANALYHGKRVLFVAEKMAALSVVQSRLEKIGLAPFCLELHSNKSTKRHVLQQLEKALKAVKIMPPAEYHSHAEKIFAERKELIGYMNALHTPDADDGLSLHDCIHYYESIGEEPISDFQFDKTIDTLILKEGVKGIEDLLGSRLETVLKIVGQPSRHPLNGMHMDRAMLMNIEEKVQRMGSDADAIREMRNEVGKLEDARELHDKLMLDNSPALLDEDPETLRRQWREIKAKWFVPRMFARKKFIKRLRQYNSLLTETEIDPLLEDLLTYRNKHEKINKLQELVKPYEEVNFKEDEVPAISLLDEIECKLRLWSDNSSKMRDWFHWSEYSVELRDKGAGCVVDTLEKSEYDAASIKGAFLKALLKHKAEKKISASEVLAVFEGMLFDEKIAAYKRLAEEFQLLTCKELYARLASRLPHTADNPTWAGEIGLLNRNISNGGRGVSVRDLFDQLPTLLPRLCPCMLMSPMSVAQYIDLDAEKFDLVVFDEASQMPTSEAVGAIARGKALIVVGDPKQMPPTSFFTSTNVDAEEAWIDDMESILEDCRTLDMPSLQLSWHYRSHHESLIAFSNNEYYEGSLVTFPSVDDQHTKVHFIPVDGYYDKGGKRCNKSEAEAIVDEIVRRLENKELRHQSIGVIAFNVMQQGLIEDVLQERLDGDKTLQQAASGMYEPIFVKNLENVQGDERDVILFSIGYGPDKGGKVSMNFGPLNNAGGERRLNVAVSRARCEMYIFSTLRSADIDLRRSKAKGVEGLKHFLHYAETGALPANISSGTSYDNAGIANQIASELRKNGYRVATGVGRSKFRVDVAIENPEKPGTYLMGILLDGKGYRDTHTTRDREIVQPSMLQSLNWKVMRVWSVDWFNNKDRVMERILERLDEPEKDIDDQKRSFLFDISKEVEQKKEYKPVEYVRYVPEKRLDPLFMSLRGLMRAILTVEQPVMFPYLCKRANTLREGPRFTNELERKFNYSAGPFYRDWSGAMWLSEEDYKNYKCYRPNSGRDITEIPEIELVNVMRETLSEQIALQEKSLIIIAARKMGFMRRGPVIDSLFKSAIYTMKNNGIIESVGDTLRLLEPSDQGLKHT